MYTFSVLFPGATGDDVKSNASASYVTQEYGVNTLYICELVYIHSTIPYIPQVLEGNWFEIQESLQCSLPKSLARQGEIIVQQSMIVSLIKILLDVHQQRR